MDEFSLLYPNVALLIAKMPCRCKTFLFDKVANIEYPFWAEFEYFLSNAERLGNIQEILRKVSSAAPFDLDIDKAWERYRDFRSAQFEITAIFLIERYFAGTVTQLIPQSTVPTPDFEVQLGKNKVTIEAKAQSGQQHGDKHPRSSDPILFDPREETDLLSWLFQEKPSSRNGKPMKPQAIAAERKGADILVCEIDYTATRINLLSQVSVLCPENTLLEEMTLERPNGEPIKATFFRASYPCTRELNRLKEIWLCDLSASSYSLVVLSRADAILREHLKCIR